MVSKRENGSGLDQQKHTRHHRFIGNQGSSQQHGCSRIRHWPPQLEIHIQFKLFQPLSYFSWLEPSKNST